MQNPRILLVIIAALFAAPLLLAILMRSSWWDFRPSELSNRGTLVQPAVAFELDSLVRMAGPEDDGADRRWRVLFLLGESCRESCQEALIGLRQVHLASGKHQDEVALWVVSRELKPAPVVADIRGVYPEFRIYHDASGSLARLVKVIVQQDQAADPGRPAWQEEALVLDPEANIILRYETGFDPNDLASDLDRLLTWSKQN